MPDTKITALTAISTVNPATYPLPIVDTADTTMAGSGTTKKITINQILGAGGTATLASATISGDLTVDTSTLKVDSANNFVGVGTTTGVNLAAGRGNLTIGGSSSAILNLSIGAADTGYVIHDGTSISLVNRIAAGSLIFSTNSTERFRIDSSGNVGIGVTPSAWSAGGYVQLPNSRAFAFAGAFGDYISNGYYDGSWKYTTTAAVSRYRQDSASHQWFTAPSGTAGTAITFTQAMTLDASGNLLVGTTSTAGSASNATALVLGGARSANGNISTTTAVASTIFSITGALRGRYEVVALIANSGNASLYTSIATILWDGNGGRVVANNGTNLTITLSGSDVQVTQSSGSTQTVFWSFFRVAL